MSLSEFTLSIILTFLPGLIAFIIVEQLTVHNEVKPYRFVIYSLLLGFACYLLYYPISLISFLHLKFHFIQSLSNSKMSLDFKEILVTTILALPLGFIVSFLINHKVLHKLGKVLRVTNKFGDLDVWSYIMNSKMPEWVVVRDIDKDIMYEGWIQAFSDSTERDEIFLRDVKVFSNTTAQLLYETPGLYLPKKREYLTIEFPSMEFSKYRKRQVDEKNGEKS